MNVRCGIGLPAARDRVRVALSLEALPKISTQLIAEKAALFVKAVQSALEQVEFVDIAEEAADNAAVNRLHPDENATAVAHLLDEQRKKKVNGPQQRADALQLLAERYLQTSTNNEAASESKTADRYQVMVHVDVETLTDSAEQSSVPPEHRHSELEDGLALARDSIRRLCCDGSVLAIHKDAQGNPLNVVCKTRANLFAMRRALTARDKGCKFPGCTCKRYVDGHHIQHWADGGETSLDDLTLLCRHHHRLVHEGGFAVRRTHEERLIFTQPDGKALKSSPEPTHATQWVEDINVGNCIHISHETGCRQRDRVIDYSMVVDGLIQRRGVGVAAGVA